MTDDADQVDEAPRHDPRPKGCLADISRDYARCARCGLAWLIGQPAPDCQPMTIGEIRDTLRNEIDALTASHVSLISISETEGFPTNPIAPLERAMRLAGVSMLVERVLSNQRILDLLKPDRRDKSHG